jgi:hypothetical protein
MNSGEIADALSGAGFVPTSRLVSRDLYARIGLKNEEHWALFGNSLWLGRNRIR